MAAPIRESYLMVGQSNMSGRGLLGELPSFSRAGRVRNFANANAWMAAAEPIDDETGAIYAVLDDGAQAVASPMLAFADALAALRLNVEIGLVPCAKGATGIDAWARDLSTATPYGAMIARAGLTGNVRGVVWYQGESDAFNSTLASTWAGKFLQLVDDFRGDLGDTDLPIIMTVLGPCDDPGTFPNWADVQSAQSGLSLPAGVGRVSAADLTVQIGDVHLTTASYVTLGQRWAGAMNALLR